MFPAVPPGISGDAPHLAIWESTRLTPAPFYKQIACGRKRIACRSRSQPASLVGRGRTCSHSSWSSLALTEAFIPDCVRAKFLASSAPPAAAGTFPPPLLREGSRRNVPLPDGPAFRQRRQPTCGTGPAPGGRSTRAAKPAVTRWSGPNPYYLRR